MYDDLRAAIRRMSGRLDCPSYLREAADIYDAGMVAMADKFADTKSCPEYLRAPAKAAALSAFGCPAKLWHGPGHQSSTQCERTEPHDVHMCHYGSHNQRAEWRTGDYTGRLREKGIDFNPESYPEDMGMTGFFDEPPQGDD